VILTFPIDLPRHAFNLRDVARAGDVWRCMQEVAVQGSALCGWHPARYREVGSAFIVRAMTVVHHREPRYGEPIEARTWVADFRRGILTRREVRLDGGDGPIAAGSQEWVHVSGNLRPTRAPPDMLAAFEPDDHEPAHLLPEWEPAEGPEHAFHLRTWHAWMDPLGHANHPLYLDWCDEATARRLASAGIDPMMLQPVAERIVWKSGIEAEQEVAVTSRLIGRVGDAVVQEHVVRREGTLAATVTTVRRLAERPERLAPLLRT
jgi:acyl-CoA thioesterase FadM